MIGGQKIKVKDNSIEVASLRTPIVNIIDELHITASILKFPDPVITSGTDSHKTGLHTTGNAIDLRCNAANGMNKTKCLQWVVTLASALGPNYDVMYEEFLANPGNSHIHIEYDP